MESNYTYSEKEKALGHAMRAKTGHTDECIYCGAMINECMNWPGHTGGSIFEPCKGVRLDCLVQETK